MHHLIYSSSATRPFSDNALQDLLTKARLHNEQQAITGVLLYHDGQFMQLLEGEEATVRALYRIIEQDARHTGILKLADKPIENRSFSEWAMAFRSVEGEAFTQLQGYQPSTSQNLIPQDLSAADVLLLNLMRELMAPDQ